MNRAGRVGLLDEFLVEVLPGNLGGIHEIEDTATKTLGNHLHLGARKTIVDLMKDLVAGAELGVLGHDDILANEENIASSLCR